MENGLTESKNIRKKSRLFLFGTYILTEHNEPNTRNILVERTKSFVA